MESNSLDDTKKYAFDIVENIGSNKFILLDGELGAGKTTLVKYIAEALGESEVVTSPTFNKMKVYDKFIHIDAYNITGSLEEYEDYFEDKLVIIEWWKNLEKEEFDKALKINVSFNNNKRKYTKVI